jgi:transposase
LRIAIVTWIERTYHRRRRQVRDELADIVRLTEVINGLAKRIGDRVREVAPALLAMPGCGELTAAKLVGEAAGVTRFKSEAALARVVFGRLHNDHQNRRKPSQPAAA